MLGLMLTVLMALVVVSVIYWIVTMLPLPQPFKQIGLVICLVILLFWLLAIFGVFGPAPGWRIHFNN